MTNRGRALSDSFDRANRRRQRRPRPINVGCKKATAALCSSAAGARLAFPKRNGMLYLQGLDPCDAVPQADAFYENFIRPPIPGMTDKRR